MRGAHRDSAIIQFFLAAAPDTPLVELAATEAGHGLSISRDEADSPLAIGGRGIYLGTDPQSREPVLNLWNRGDAPVVELSTDADAHGCLTLTDRNGRQQYAVSAVGR